VTLFGIFLTPVFYYVIQWFASKGEGRPSHAAAPPLPHEEKQTHSAGAAMAIQTKPLSRGGD
jgi:hypothetical protein